MREMQEAISLYVEVIKPAIPFGIAFAICDFIVTTFMDAAFGGKYRFRGRL